MATKKLDFNFAPIDVNILDHEKMLQACEPTEEHPAGDIRPFGLWAWCAVYVTRNRTRGRVTRAVIRSAPGGIANDIVAAKLAAAGLLVAIDDGSFEVYNHSKKLPHSSSDPRSSGAIREARRRAKRKAGVANDHASHEASQPVTEGVTRDVTGASRLSSLISPISESSSGRDPDPTSNRAGGTVVHSGETLPDDARGKFESLTQMRPMRTPVTDVWAKFCNHFTGKHFASREALIARWDSWVRDQWGFDDKAKRGGSVRGPGGGPRGDRQGLPAGPLPWLPTGTDPDFGGDA